MSRPSAANIEKRFWRLVDMYEIDLCRLDRTKKRWSAVVLLAGGRVSTFSGNPRTDVMLRALAVWVL